MCKDCLAEGEECIECRQNKSSGNLRLTHTPLIFVLALLVIGVPGVFFLTRYKPAPYHPSVAERFHKDSAGSSPALNHEQLSINPVRPGVVSGSKMLPELGVRARARQVNLAVENKPEPGQRFDSDSFMDSLAFCSKPFSVVPPETPYGNSAAVPMIKEHNQSASSTISDKTSPLKKTMASNLITAKKPSGKTGKKTLRVASSGKKYKSNTLAGRLFGNNRFSKYHLDRVPTSSKIITLSFDGDHLNNCVAPVLEVLEKNGIKANIFLTGKFIQLFPESVLAIYRAGHEIGNHSWNHPHLTQYEQNRTQKTRANITREYFLSQLQRTSDAYVKLTGSHFQPFWRAPFGEHNLQIRTWAYSAGYLHIGWTRGYDTMDWMIDPRGKYYLSPQKLEKKLLDDLKNPGHKIILMHLGSKRPDPSQRPYTILNDFIAKAREKGYRFATVSDVMKENAGFQMASGTP